MNSVFSRVYWTNVWGSDETASGAASELSQTTVVREALPSVLRELKADSLLDAPCGDFHWMSHVDLDLQSYVGVDVVPELIAENEQRYAAAGVEFRTLDITRDLLPRADLILCRDCLVHFSYRNIFRALRNFKRSGSRYLLTTTFPGRSHNVNVVTGGWRPLNLQLAPFRFPQPIKLIDEHCTLLDGRYADKSLGLWQLEHVTPSRRR